MKHELVPLVLNFILKLNSLLRFNLFLIIEITVLIEELIKSFSKVLIFCVSIINDVWLDLLGVIELT